ncbi:MAG: deoxyribodipyrimidine photolyase [Chitinivibrionales bacterium]|nr:deoxyribodipyrimidine photolyase [Chitinivibrionales bacterium]
MPPDRATPLNDRPLARGAYVLYWMQHAQRVRCNHALTYAIDHADDLRLPVVVCFGLTAHFPDANSRHYRFMLEGLRSVRERLAQRGMPLVVRMDEPPAVVESLAAKAAMVVTDVGYLRVERDWRRRVARAVDCRVVEVETDVVVPVAVAYPKEAYTAGVLRPHITKVMNRWLVEAPDRRPKRKGRGLELESLDISDTTPVLKRLGVDDSISAVIWLRAGEEQAEQHLRQFVETRLDRFGDLRNDPSQDYLSNLSPYLHFGQLSPIVAALAARAARSPGTAPFLEELIVRRELAMNFAYYNPHYDSFAGLPDWARHTLQAHARDKRSHRYSLRELDQAHTHDKYWNAAQREYLVRGKMHGYMRMYWGKKVLEWSPGPEEAFKRLLYMNNRYSLDGRDPNSYAGVAWCFGKHDRAWKERGVFGKVRYMSEEGLRRKYDMDGYVRRVEGMSG